MDFDNIGNLISVSWHFSKKVLAMTPRQKNPKSDYGKKQEKTLEKLAFITLFYLALGVLVTNVQLIVFSQADMMLPFKLLIIMGFCYLLANTFLNIYYHLKERKFENPQILCLKIVAIFPLVASMFYSLPSGLSLTAVFHMDFAFDLSFIIAFAVGIFAALMGLFLSMKRFTSDKEK